MFEFSNLLTSEIKNKYCDQCIVIMICKKVCEKVDRRIAFDKCSDIINNSEYYKNYILEELIRTSSPLIKHLIKNAEIA